MTQKAQITIFIILGIFLLLVAMLVIYLVYSQTGVELKSFPKELLDNMQRTATSCLEKTANEAIKKLTEQGGVIYTDQNGLTDPLTADTIQVGNDAITKLVELQTFTISDPPPSNFKISTTTPEYPWTTFPKVGNQQKYTANILFGVNKIQPLDEDANSWAAQIESKTKKELISCINIPQLQNLGITIGTITPVITVTINEKDVLVSSSQITLNAPDGTSANLQNIKAKIPVNLKKLYETVTKIIDNEVFDPTKKLVSTSEATVNTKKESGNTIVTVVQGPTTFKFAIPNRKPALEFIPDPTEVFCEGTEIKFDSNNKINIIAPTSLPTGETSCPSKNLDVRAVDPDEDVLSYKVESLLPVSTLPFQITNAMKTSSTMNCIKLKASVSENSNPQNTDYQEVNLKLKPGVTC